MKFTSESARLSQLVSQLTPRQRLLILTGAVVVVLTGIIALTAGRPMATASAVPVGAAASSSDLSGAGSWGSGIWAVVATLLVLGLAYGSLYALRLFGQQGRFLRRGANALELRSSLRLSNNQSLHLVQFESQRLLIGASAAGIVLLARSVDGQMPDTVGDFSQALEQAWVEGKA